MAEAERPEETIRLALVMNGGVSLAVWMGGVTHELTRLLGRDPTGHSQAWGRILSVELDSQGEPLPRRRVVVDYAAGTSAGGLNGCLLATSLARGGRLEGLKRLWMEEGHLAPGKLLPTGEDRGRSVLDGQFFHKAIRKALDAIPDDPANAADVTLLVTSTALARKGSQDRVEVEDLNGNRLAVGDHTRVYRFSTASRSRAGTDEFAETKTLARAARASASFPVAFAPVLETHDLVAHRVRGERHIDPDDPTWLIDGGVLDNAPFGPLLDEITRNPRSDSGPRWVVYVVPDAVTSEKPTERNDAAPTWSEVAGALWGTKSEVDLRGDLEALRRLQETGRAAHVRPERFISSAEAGSIEVAPLLEMYRRTRAGGFAQWLQEVHTVVEKLGSRRPEDAAVERLLAEQPIFVPHDLTPTREDAWQWGSTVARHLLLWMSRDARSAASAGTVAALVTAEHALEAVHEQVVGLYRPERFAGAQPDYVVRETAEDCARLMRQVSTIMSSAVDTWSALHGYEVKEAWARLLGTEVLVNHAEWHAQPDPPEFEVVLVNPGSPSVDAYAMPEGSGPPERRPDPNAKLYGTRLGHFGGFGAEEYRAHDWLWGRLDAAACISTALLKGVPGEVQDALRQQLVDEILDDEGVSKEKLQQDTERVEQLDTSEFTLDLLGRDQVDVAALTESALDMLLRTEAHPALDRVTDAVIESAGDAAEKVSVVVEGFLRVTQRLGEFAAAIRRRLPGG